MTLNVVQCGTSKVIILGPAVDMNKCLLPGTAETRLNVWLWVFLPSYLKARILAIAAISTACWSLHLIGSPPYSVSVLTVTLPSSSLRNVGDGRSEKGDPHNVREVARCHILAWGKLGCTEVITTQLSKPATRVHDHAQQRTIECLLRAAVMHQS